jgi:hypothetical protein
MNFSKNLDFTLPTSIGGFRGPCISQGPWTLRYMYLCLGGWRVSHYVT